MQEYLSYELHLGETGKPHAQLGNIYLAMFRDMLP